MAEPITHYLEIGSRIATQLRDQCPGLMEVFTSPGFNEEALKTWANSAPCALVIYGGVQVEAATNRGQNARHGQAWLVVLLYWHGSVMPGSGIDVHSEAGPILEEIHQALNGWEVAPGVFLQPETPPSPPLADAQLGIYPTQFRAALQVRSRPNAPLRT